MAMRLQGKTALISGGSSGIGSQWRFHSLPKESPVPADYSFSNRVAVIFTQRIPKGPAPKRLRRKNRSEKGEKAKLFYPSFRERTRRQINRGGKCGHTQT